MVEARTPYPAVSVLAALPSLRGGGSERVMTTLLRHFDAERVEVALAVIDGREPAFASDLPTRMELLDLGCDRVLRALPKLCRLIWQRRPRIVFTTLSHLNLMLAIVKPLLPRSVRLVARESNVLSEVVRTERRSSVWRWAYRRFYPRLDHIVCQSRAMQDDLCEHFGVERHKTSLIPNPIDLKRIARLSTAADREDDPATSVKEDVVRLVAVGRLEPQKGFDILLRAMHLVDAPMLRLDLLGDGPELLRLRELAETLGLASQVHFRGFQSNPYAWMHRADALVLSSRYEGLPNAVIEALACGTPVITLPIPPALEIIAGIEQAIAAQGMSAEDLAQAMSQWLAGPRERVPSHHLDRFEVGAVTRQYEAILLHVSASV